MSVKYQLEGDVAVITLNRPDRFNAIEVGLAAGVIDGMRRAGEEARAVVLTGEGKAFCAGADLSVLQGDDESGPDLEQFLDNVFHPMVHALTDAVVPVVAAVNGVAAGAGLGIALGCDIRIMAESAFMVSAFTAIGLAPDSGTTYWLPHHIGVSRAIELAMTNRRVSAAEAHSIGLCSEVAPDDEAVE
ncbi:MAG: enoyl-CoA hydratase/isomerase family protein, partial [Acidimicrobiia bacterium]